MADQQKTDQKSRQENQEPVGSEVPNEPVKDAAKRVADEQTGYTIDAATGRVVDPAEAKKINDERSKRLAKGEDAL